MKKVIVVLFFCFISLGLIADEVTNPFVLPAKKRIMINFGYQFLNTNVVTSNSSGTFRMNYLRGIVYYGVTNKLSVYVKAGMSDFNTKATKGEWEQLFGFGIRSVLSEKPFKLAVDFHISRMFTDGESKATGVISDIDWQELQLTFATAYDIKPLSTYFGIKFRTVDGVIDPREDFPELRYDQDKFYSFFGGFDYPLTKNIVFELEAGAVGEYYISLSSRYTF